MADYNNADMAVVLPSYGMSPAQADMFQAQMAAKQPKVKPYEPPAIPITPKDYKDDNVKKLYNDYLTKKSNEYQDWAVSNKASEADLKNHILSDGDMRDRMSSFDRLDAMHSAIPDKARELQKTYGTDSHVPFQNKAAQTFANDMFEFDANGKAIAPKPMSSLNLDAYDPFKGTDDIKFLQKNFSADNGASDAYIKALPKNPISGTYNNRDAKGVVTKRGYTGAGNDLFQMQYNNDADKTATGNFKIPTIAQPLQPDPTNPNAPTSIDTLPPARFSPMWEKPNVRYSIIQLMGNKIDDARKAYPNASDETLYNNLYKGYLESHNNPLPDGSVRNNGKMDAFFEPKEANLQPITKNSFNINLGNGGKNFVPIPNVKSVVNMTKDQLGVDKNGTLSIDNLMNTDATINGKIGLKGNEIATFYSSINSNLPKETNDKIIESQNKFNNLLGIPSSYASKLLETGKVNEYYKLIADKANESNKQNGVQQTFTQQDIKNGLLKSYKTSSVQPITNKAGDYLDKDGNTIEVNGSIANANKSDEIPPNAKMSKQDVVQYYNPTSLAYDNLHNSFIRQFQEGNQDEKATIANYGFTPGQHEIVKHSAQYSGNGTQSAPVQQAKQKTVSGIKWK